MPPVVELICSYCGKRFKRLRWKHTQFLRRKLKKPFCSQKCRCEYGANWKGGKYRLKTGYIVINKRKNNRIFEHRLVMEKHLGRKLTTSECIHHINGDTTDNRIENLVLCKSHGKHTEKYHSQNRLNGQFYGNK